MQWDVIATVALFGLANAGLLIFRFGGLEARMTTTERRVEKLETTQQNLVSEVGTLKGEVRA